MSPWEGEERRRAPFREEDKDLVKEAMREALKGWLDEKAAEFGRWSLRWILYAAFGALVYVILLAHGWRPPWSHG